MRLNTFSSHYPDLGRSSFSQPPPNSKQCSINKLSKFVDRYLPFTLVTSYSLRKSDGDAAVDGRNFSGKNTFGLPPPTPLPFSINGLVAVEMAAFNFKLTANGVTTADATADADDCWPLVCDWLVIVGASAIFGGCCDNDEWWWCGSCLLICFGLRSSRDDADELPLPIRPPSTDEPTAPLPGNVDGISDVDVESFCNDNANSDFGRVNANAWV